MPLIQTDDLGTWTQLGIVATIAWKWQRAEELSLYSTLLLRLTPLFAVERFKGFFWVRAEHASTQAISSVLPSRRYYPEIDAQPTLLDLEVPLYLRQMFPIWEKRIEVMFVPSRTNREPHPVLKIEETGYY